MADPKDIETMDDKADKQPAKKGSDPDWIEKATSKMKSKGTLGSFGKATGPKIAKAEKQGGAMAKKANFAKAVTKFSGKKV